MMQGKKEQPPFFAFLDHILKKRKINHTTLKGLYMVNRFLSMNSPEFASIVNMTTNRWAKIVSMNNDMDLIGKLFFKILPKVGKNADYIKKSEKDEDDANTDMADTARVMNLSQRELKEYAKTLKLL